MSKSTPIVIYQMGKVGSTAIYNALYPIFENVYQVHSLVPAKLEKTTRILREKGLGIPKHVTHSNCIIEHYLKKGVPVKIITPIRSPLERNMSAFFQELSTEVILKDDLRNGLEVKPFIKQIKLLPFPNEWKNLLIQKVIQPKLVKHIDFLIEYFKANYRHHIPLDWFDVEFKEALGIDVFNQGFDHTVGYQEYSQKNLSVLVFKSELGNETKSKIINDFFNGNYIAIKSEHKSDAKSYGPAYRLFKNKIQADDSIFNSYHTSKYSNFFYPVVN